MPRRGCPVQVLCKLNNYNATNDNKHTTVLYLFKFLFDSLLAATQDFPPFTHPTACMLSEGKTCPAQTPCQGTAKKVFLASWVLEQQKWKTPCQVLTHRTCALWTELPSSGNNLWSCCKFLRVEQSRVSGPTGNIPFTNSIYIYYHIWLFHSRHA